MNYSIAVIIHSRNSEKDIKECLQSARLLSQNIIVIDSESTDKTASIAKNTDAQVYPFPYSQYVEPSRQFGISQAKTDWVFILDTDERLTPKLAKEIKEKLEKNITHYKIPRKNIFGRIQWLKHGGWWPDYQIRLIQKKYFRNWPKEIHSTPVIDGKQGYITHPVLHYFHGNIEEMVEKTIIFESIESELLFKASRPVQTVTFFRKFLGELYRRIIKHAGFLDGQIGIMEGIYQAFSKTITYLFLYEKKSRTI